MLEGRTGQEEGELMNEVSEGGGERGVGSAEIC